MRQSFPQRTSSLARTGTSASVRRKAAASPVSMAVFTSKWCRSSTSVLIVSAVTAICFGSFFQGLCWEPHPSPMFLHALSPDSVSGAAGTPPTIAQGESIHSPHTHGPIEPCGGFAEFEIEVSAGPGQALASTSSGELVINRLERNAHLAVSPTATETTIQSIEATILPARPALFKLPQCPGLHGVRLDNSVGAFRRALRYAFYDCTREMPKSKLLLTWAPFCCRSSDCCREGGLPEPLIRNRRPANHLGPEKRASRKVRPRNHLASDPTPPAEAGAGCFFA